MNSSIIVHSKPFIPDGTLKVIDGVLKSGMLAQGEFARHLESSLAIWAGANDGVAVSSGSAAIYLALKALGVNLGDEVILPTYVCRSVLDAVIASGATPVLCDVSVDWILITDNVDQYINRKTKAIIVPHMYGIFADIDSFKRFNIPVIEDCAQAIGGKGSFQIKGDIAVLSFHPTKCLTTGEGGMALSSDEKIIRKMRLLRDGPEGRELFAPLSDINSAIGVVQMRNYSDFLYKREKIAKGYMEIVRRLIPGSLRDVVLTRSMFFRFPLYVKGRYEECKTLFADYQINVRNGVDLLLHRTLCEADDKFPNAVDLIKSTVLIPLYPALTEEEYERIVKAMNEIFGSRLKEAIQTKT